MQLSPVMLEKMRRIKNTLARLTKTAETFKEVLQALLEDDKDMCAWGLGHVCDRMHHIFRCSGLPAVVSAHFSVHAQW